jgi:tetratricopeptide (TPR) repeat protein
MVLFHEGKFRDAASYFELSLEYCGEEDVLIWANWAKALYWAEGGRTEAIPKFQRAIAMTEERWKTSPGDPSVLGDLIDFHAMMGDAETTRRLIAVGDSLASDNGELLYHIGSAYELIGDRVAALRYLTDAVRHGVAVETIRETPELEGLVQDPRFVRMIAAASGQVEATADSLQ